MMRIKKLLIVCLMLTLCLADVVFCQKIPAWSLDKLHKNSIYIVARGTRQKLGFIAEKFNLKDKNITHVGIGMMEHDTLVIYNVTNVESDISAFVIEGAKAFTSYSDIYYLGIWEYRTSEKEMEKLSQLLQSYRHKKITFDMDFNEKDNDNLYCSEFSAKVLMALNPKTFQFPLKKVRLNHFYSQSLGRKTLRYYPVDFFQANAEFNKVFEKFF